MSTKGGGTTRSEKKTTRLLPGLAVKDGFMRHPFDLEFGVRTSGLVAGRNLKSGHRADRHNTAYFGVAPSVFREMIVRWRRLKPAAPIDQFTFVDLGAGMGRALLLAAEFPFRAVLGVELNPTLARIGRRNIALWRTAGRARSPMRMICRDAAEFELPPGPCVVFLFNPFGAPVLRRILTAWKRDFAAREGQLDILYVNNEQHRILERQPGIIRLFAGEVRRSRADAIADHRILANQPDGEYAVTNWEDCSIHRWVGKSAT
ncbi:MAG: class I SAM-dependent methyltransferase [Terracidiphilus sp.]